MPSIWEDARTGKLTENRLLDHLCEDPDLLDCPDASGITPLGHAMKASRASVVGVLLENSADPDVPCQGLTPTYLAVLAPANSERILQLLLNRDPETLDSPIASRNENTPLMAAIGVAQNPSLVKQLLSAGASLDKRNRRGMSGRKLISRLPAEKQREIRAALVRPARFTGIPQVSPFFGVFIYYAFVNNKVAFREPVPTGGSIFLTAPSIRLDITLQKTESVIDFLSLSSATGQEEIEDSFDVPLQISVNRADRVLECKSKQAYGGYGARTELKPAPWFRVSDPVIRVDIKENEFVVSVNGRRAGSVRRAIRTPSVTHLTYWTISSAMAPPMGDMLTVSTYRKSSLVL
ncbi:hypothetical protein BJY01DRAFT_242889 [Aspergillus pseudoustus]|uniref:Ankyrin repeat-containing domain protein n=1 Tax=Aspergillus pseudoustus TaxID=1810923 RepID=A0ABR4KUI6_9EURO